LLEYRDMHPRERLPYAAIEHRRPLRLPDGLRLIVWPVLALEEWDLARPMARLVISPPQSQPMQPDIPNWTWHEYGMRVGFWRIKRMLDALRIGPTVNAERAGLRDLSRGGSGLHRGWLGTQCARL
jgi:allantoinase